MVNSAGIEASLAGRYASALFELASEAGAKKGLAQTVEMDLQNLGASVSESDDLRDLISNPQISRDQAADAMAALGKKMKLNALTQNFLGVLAANRRLAALPDMIAAFAAIAAATRGEVTANVISAHPLSAKQTKALAERLTAREGRKVTLKTSIDPQLLGGLVVTIGSQRIDGSILTRLNSLAKKMKG